MEYSKLTDLGLVRLCQQGRDEALSELYDRYSRLVYSWARSTLNDPLAAEEVLQDVFLKLWEKAGDYQAEQGRLSTWLIAITRNRSIDMLRQRKARPESLPDSLEDILRSQVSANHKQDADGLIELQEQAEHTRKALLRLPAEQRQVIFLSFYQGYSQSEIAKQLKLPLGTVKTRARGAMQKLRQWMEEELSLEP